MSFYYLLLNRAVQFSVVLYVYNMAYSDKLIRKKNFIWVASESLPKEAQVLYRSL